MCELTKHHSLVNRCSYCLGERGTSVWHGFCLSTWPNRASDRMTFPSTLLSGFLEESTALLPQDSSYFAPRPGVYGRGTLLNGGLQESTKDQPMASNSEPSDANDSEGCFSSLPVLLGLVGRMVPITAGKSLVTMKQCQRIRLVWW